MKGELRFDRQVLSFLQHLGWAEQGSNNIPLWDIIPLWGPAAFSISILIPTPILILKMQKTLRIGYLGVFLRGDHYIWWAEQGSNI